MEENHAAAFESITNDDHHDATSTAADDYNNTHHTHRPRKKKESNAEVINNQNKLVLDIASANGNGDRRQLILEAQRANVDLDDVAPVRSKLRCIEGEDLLELVRRRE
ncbi:hypothetical protein D8674_029117 [Pyrus ussuriensis x Pyrus communis]|uniref:Uncharacterized protein n=1 Tax=Pyrus ussuriensis x Pyrus communis TaxID=2448454 RepID=A0A5N5I5G6_9ROSA|nr:hypothetical protein D8674_029117 [Pyrus ussuriensis x Pyrus communis]